MAGTYPITASGAVDPDYTISYVAGTLTVTSAALTITADNQTKVYGAELPALTASYSGFVNGDTSASLTTQPTLTTTATAHSDTGAYAVTASGAVDPDYTISYVGGTLTVSPATLTVTANDLTRPPGEANPPLTYTFSGLVNGDTASVVSGTPILSTTATILSPAGQYPITIAVGTLSAANYDFTTVGGTLTVGTYPAITISPTTLPVATVGDAYSQQLTASGGSGSGYSFTATGLPAGLSLTTLGLLSGTPTTAIGSPFVVDVTVTDGDGGTGSQNYTLTVNATDDHRHHRNVTGAVVLRTGGDADRHIYSDPLRIGPHDRDGRLLRGEHIPGNRAADRHRRPCWYIKSLDVLTGGRRPHHLGHLLGRRQLLNLPPSNIRSRSK